MWLCIRLNNASLNGPAIDLQKMPIFIFSDKSHFDLGGYVNKLPFGADFGPEA